MNKEILILYRPINFYHSTLVVCIKVLLVFISGGVLFYTLSNQLTREYVIKNWQYFVMVLFSMVVLAVFQNWYNSKIYVYEVIIYNQDLTIKWQELGKFKEVVIPVNQVTAKLIPAGKDTPYLEIKIAMKDDTIILNQTYYPGWNKVTMKKFIDDLKGKKTY
ncbi:MAG: hypothetical protein R2809_08555 [Flavobacteriales bacterium]